MGNHQFAEHNRILEEIYNDVICLPRDDVKKTRDILRYFIREFFLPKLKDAEPSLKLIFEQVYITGSFYDNIHNNGSAGFKINCVLRLPIQRSDLYLRTPGGTHSGLAMFGLKREFEKIVPVSRGRYTKYRFLKSFLASQGAFFDTKNVRNWFNDIIRKWLHDTEYFCINKLWYRVSCSDESAAGPVSIKISTDNFEVNLEPVPVLEVDGIFLQPKSLRNRIGSCTLYWRISYPIVERAFLQQNTCAKKVVKLLKSVRDTYNLWQLSSYYIKTVVLLCVDAHGKTWYEKDLFYWVSETTVLLIQYLKEYQIPFYHDQQCNLLQDLDYEIIDRIRNKYTQFLHDVEKNPDFMRDHLGGGHTRVIKTSAKKNMDVDTDDEFEGARILSGNGSYCVIQ